MKTRVECLPVFLLSCCLVAQDHPSVVNLRNFAPLTNRDVITMVKAQFSDATVVKTIQTSRTDFDVSVRALLRLKNAGVSEQVINAMLSSASGKSRPAGAKAIDKGPQETAPAPVIEQAVQREPNDPKLPDDVGVFLMQHDKFVTIEPEIVNWRSGGVLKRSATLGLDKGHVNGTVPGPHSALRVSFPHEGGPLEFYIRCPEGNSASEYQLLRLWDKGNRREFRAVTGGILHMSGGAQMNAVQFKFEKVAPRTYRIPFPSLEPGEYGFLAPGATGSSNAASLGKIYSFRVPD